MPTTIESSFDERIYLIANPDVAKAVEDGRLSSGWEHYQRSGHGEGRVASAPQFVRELARRLAALTETVAERDGRITALTRAVAERDEALQMRPPGTLRRFATRIKHLSRQPPLLLLAKVRKRLWRTLGKGQVAPHFAPPKDDYCFAVPFKYPFDRSESPPRLAVICHLFYPEMLPEFSALLLNIPFQFDLYITTDTEVKRTLILAGLKNWSKGAVEVRLAPNRGRDIAPKLVTCRDVYDRYEFFLHIHSKRSPHADVLSPWRPYLLETLLGSEEIVRSVFEAFAADPKLGMIAPEHFDAVRSYIGWGWNVRKAKQFAGQLGIKLIIDDKVDFPSGSMFWGRCEALRPLLNKGLKTEDFEPEHKQLDGTLGHVIERLYFVVCERAGYRWMKVIHPELSNRTERIVSPADRVELCSAIAETQHGLLNTRTKRNRSLTARSVIEAGLNPRWRAAHDRSDLRHLDFLTFCEEVRKHAVGQDSLVDFDESFYLAVHPDVAAEVARGVIFSGYLHFCLAGRSEGRIYSDTALRRTFGRDPACSVGALAPVKRRQDSHWISLDHLPDGQQSLLLIMLSHLQEDLFYAGYSEFFKDYAPIFDRFDRVIVAVVHPQFDASLAVRYSSRIEVIHYPEVVSLKQKPSLLLGFNSHLAEVAHKMLPSHPERVIYYCQDFEAGFFPLGADYIIGERAVANSRNLIVSTELLKKFLQQRGLVTNQKIFVTQPRIEIFKVNEHKTRRLFFYYRPEEFNRRNLPELLVQAVEEFCQIYKGYEIFLVGSVASSYSYKVNGTPVFVLSKLPKDDYVRLIASCDVVVSTIYSAHPGVIAFQAAASGIPAVTNVFENRSADLLRKISSNIVPFDPVRGSLLEAIEKALAMPKGQPSFNEALYSGGGQAGSLADFHDEILRGLAEKRVAA